MRSGHCRRLPRVRAIGTRLMPMYDPIVLESRQTLMQRIADYVRTGHTHWTSGQIPLERAPAVARKFARIYEVDLDRNRRFRAKRAGEANAVLLLLRKPADMLVTWFLLCTDGEHVAHQLERLHDASAKAGRVQFGDYELVRLNKRIKPRATRSQRDAGIRLGMISPAKEPEAPTLGRLVLTWRMNADAYEGWRERALTTARGLNPFAARQFLAELYSVPGFFGARQQVGKVAALFRREFRRRHGSLAGCPPLPKLGYVARRADRGARLSRLVGAR